MSSLFYHVNQDFVVHKMNGMYMLNTKFEARSDC